MTDLVKELAMARSRSSERFFSLKTPCVMGILNVTPDSQASEGRYLDVSYAVDHALSLIAEGAAIIDVGGEATNPQLTPVVPLNIELARVIPVIKALRRQSNIPISVDTSKPEVMKAALDAGANFINDVRALSEPGALAVAAQANVPVCLMHMQYPHGRAAGEMIPMDVDIVTLVKNYLADRVEACLEAGILPEHIVIDPGIGHGNFGKNLQQNLTLLKKLDTFKELGFPLLICASRKTFLGEILDLPSEDRMVGSLAAAVFAACHGASIFRVHDVKATVEALKVTTAILGA